ncbi:hypothetical protein MMC11_007481 [Xylographa trunciseda]|nr:hypothetical protein [Xylographa trunciseda]
MTSPTPTGMINPSKTWIRYGQLLWLCENTSTCPVYLELCKRRDEDKQLEAVYQACKDAQVALSIAWKTVGESIKNGTDTLQAVEAANIAQARYDEAGELRAQLRATIGTRQDEWLVGRTVVRKLA